MKKDIIIAGVGGQGIISIAATIGYAAIFAGLNLKQSEVHGMSQRGGDVQSHLRLSEQEIASDLIPEGQADIIISVEPMEALRYLNMLSTEGWLITNTNPYINISDYPSTDDLISYINKLDNHVALDADRIAKSLGTPKSANIVVLGAALPYIGIDVIHFENALSKLFSRKGEKVINDNINALMAGLEFTRQFAIS